MAVIGYSLLFIKRLFSFKKGQNPKAVRRWGAAPFPLWKEDKDRKRCLLSANSYGIRAGVKRNVLFLQRARMQKLINESTQHVFLSGERGGPSAWGRMVESRIHYVNQKE